jgi:predicted nucleic acid-binding protein
VRLLDTDVMVDLRRQYPPALAWFAQLAEAPGLLGFVVMELIAGCRDGAEMRSVLRSVAPFRIYWPTTDDCDRALTTYARAHLTHRLDLLDAVIGECAVGLSATLCTFNVKHYRAIRRLRTEQPYVKS